MNALVTGATGFLGGHLTRRLLSEEDGVRILARSAERASELRDAGAEVRVGDLRDPEAIRGLAEGVDVVYHLASAIAGPWEDFEAVDVRGTERLLEEAARAGARRFVYASSVAVYAIGEAPHDVRLDETGPVADPERAGNYTRAKVLAEERVREADRAGRVEGVICRLGLIFGPGRSPYFPETPHFGKRVGNWAVVLGDDEFPLPLTYVGNTVEALRLCATVPGAAGEVVNVVDENVPRGEHLERVAALTGERVRLLCLPRLTAYLVGGGVQVAARMLGREAPTSPKLMLDKVRRVGFEATAAREVLGWSPSVSLEDGLRRTVSADSGPRTATAAGAAA